MKKALFLSIYLAATFLACSCLHAQSGVTSHSSGVLGGGTGAADHGDLSGLGDDDHSQYPLSAGRAGSQTVTGGTAAGEDLTLKSTSNAVKGNIILEDDVSIGTTTNDGSNLYVAGSQTGYGSHTVRSNGSLILANGSGQTVIDGSSGILSIVGQGLTRNQGIEIDTESSNNLIAFGTSESDIGFLYNKFVKLNNSITLSLGASNNLEFELNTSGNDTIKMGLASDVAGFSNSIVICERDDIDSGNTSPDEVLGTPQFYIYGNIADADADSFGRMYFDATNTAFHLTGSGSTNIILNESGNNVSVGTTTNDGSSLYVAGSQTTHGTQTVASSGSFVLSNGSGQTVIDGDSGILTISGQNLTNNNDIVIDTESAANNIIISTNNATAFRFTDTLKLDDNVPLRLGVAADDASLEHDTNGNDTLKLGLGTDLAGNSASFVLCEWSDINSGNTSPSEVLGTPQFYIYGNTADADADTYGRMFFDATNTAFTIDTGSTGNLNLITDGGSVNIGTVTQANGAALSVNGSVSATNGFTDNGVGINAPDFVFEPEYLKTIKHIDEIEQELLALKHFPNLPDANDTKAWSKITYSQRDMKILENLEVAYIYMFELNARIKQLWVVIGILFTSIIGVSLYLGITKINKKEYRE